MSEAVCVAAGNCILGESPLWSPAEQALYWVDIHNPAIHRLDPATGARRHWPVETEIGAIGLAGEGRLIAGRRTGFALFDPETGAFEDIADPEGEGRLNPNRMNDGKVDRGGRFWCGTMQDPARGGGRAPVGVLYRLDGDHSWRATADGLRVPNAICWSPDDRTMYFADSHANCIWAHDYDPASGVFANRRVFASLAEGAGHPDGATVDADGFVWNANIFGGRITRYDPDGRVERIIELPVPQVTACAFGGPALDVLYVTTASMGMDAEDLARQPSAGALFAVEVGISGLPEPIFGG